MMGEQLEQAQMEGTEPGSSAEGESGGSGRFRRAFAFLKSPRFWGRLGVVAVVLGVGVALGWGGAHLMDDDRRSDHYLFKGATAPFDATDRKWLGEGKGEGKWGNGWERRGWRQGKRSYRDQEIYVPDEVWERVESLIEAMEELVERVSERVGGEGSLEGLLERFFESGFRGGDGGGEDGWKGEFGGDFKGGPDPFGEDGGGWWKDNGGGGPFEGFGFSFGGILPGLAFLEDCDLAPEDMMDALEGLDSFEGGEDSQEFFEMMEQLLAEACESPPER